MNRVRAIPLAGALLAVLLGAGAAPAAPQEQPGTASPENAAPAAGDPRLVVGPPRGTPVTGAALDARTEEVGSLLRCPVCQGLSVADSPSTTAQKMKSQVRDMLAAGYAQDQILAYFEASYGEFVRLEPPLRGVNWLVWIAPIAGLLAGGAVVVWTLRAPRRAGATAAAASRSAAEPAAHSPSEPAAGGDLAPGLDALPDDGRLAGYVLRVREEVYGWPGGRSPGSPPAPAAPASPASGAPAADARP